MSAAKSKPKGPARNVWIAWDKAIKAGGSIKLNSEELAIVAGAALPRTPDDTRTLAEWVAAVASNEAKGVRAAKIALVPHHKSTARKPFDRNAAKTDDAYPSYVEIQKGRYQMSQPQIKDGGLWWTHMVVDLNLAAKLQKDGKDEGSAAAMATFMLDTYVYGNTGRAHTCADGIVPDTLKGMFHPDLLKWEKLTDEEKSALHPGWQGS